MNNRWTYLLTMTLMLGLVPAGFAISVTIVDDFNDGVRNTEYWQVASGVSGRFREREGKLFYSSTTTQDTYARWEWKLSYAITGSNRLDVICKLDMPLALTISGQRVIYGIGLRDADAPSKYVGFYMTQHDTSRWFTTDIWNGGVGARTSYGPKKFPETILLRIRYDNLNGTVRFAYKSPSGALWQSVVNVDLDTAWGSAISRRLQPFVYAFSSGVMVAPINFKIDNFTIINKHL